MNQNQLREKKIAVVGVGGVGGYVAAMLANKFPHVAIAARGERRKSMLEKGIVFHGDYKGEIVSYPETIVESAEDMEPQDVIFLCVKNFSLEEACAQMKNAVTDDTVIIPIMNGADPGDRTRAFLGKGVVLDSLIYVVAFANEDYSITQKGKFTDLRFGIKLDQKYENRTSEELQPKVQEVADILKMADIDFKISEDIEGDIWKKYIFNCAYNVETAYYNQPIGKLRADKEKAKEFEKLVYEAYAVAKAKNINVEEKDIESIIYRFYNFYAEDATSSLMRDMAAGRMAEVETFPGFIVHESKRLGLMAPVSEKMYQGMLQKM